MSSSPGGRMAEAFPLPGLVTPPGSSSQQPTIEELDQLIRSPGDACGLGTGPTSDQRGSGRLGNTALMRQAETCFTTPIKLSGSLRTQLCQTADLLLNSLQNLSAFGHISSASRGPTSGSIEPFRRAATTTTLPTTRNNSTATARVTGLNMTACSSDGSARSKAPATPDSLFNQPPQAYVSSFSATHLANVTGLGSQEDLCEESVITWRSGARSCNGMTYDRQGPQAPAPARWARLAAMAAERQPGPLTTAPSAHVQRAGSTGAMGSRPDGAYLTPVMSGEHNGSYLAPRMRSSTGVVSMGGAAAPSSPGPGGELPVLGEGRLSYLGTQRVRSTTMTATSGSGYNPERVRSVMNIMNMLK